MAAANKKYRSRLASWLTSHTSHINFTIGVIVVTPAGYEMVAEAISSGKIKVDIQNLGPGVGGKYTFKGNGLVINSALQSDAALLGAVLIHECTHAIVDLNKWTVLQIDNEAAGNISEFMFGCKYYADKMPKSVVSHPGYQAAQKIMKGQSFNHEIQELRKLLLTDADYQALCVHKVKGKNEYTSTTGDG